MCLCPTRHIVLALATLCLAAIFSNVLIFHFSVLYMEKQVEYPTVDTNSNSSTRLRYRRQADVDSPQSNSIADQSYALNLTKSDVSPPDSEEVGMVEREFGEDPPIDNTSTTKLIYVLTSPATTTMRTTISVITTGAPTPKHASTSTSKLPTATEPPSTMLKLKTTKLFSAQEQTMLFSAAGVGALLSLLPFAWLTYKFGARICLAVACVVSAIVTALSPLAIQQGGFGAFLVCRILQGVTIGGVFPVIAVVTSKWAPLREQGLFINVLSSCLQLAAVFAMLTSGLVCSSLSWPIAFYGHAVASVALALLWVLATRDMPVKHPWMTGLELDKIMNGRRSLRKKRQSKGVPYQGIAFSPAIWAILIASFGSFLVLLMLLFYMPVYMSSVLEYSALDIGCSAALPPMIQFVVKLVAGYTAEHSPCFDRSPNTKVRIYNSLAAFGAATFLALLGAFALSTTTDALIAVALIVCAVGTLGLHAGGFYRSVVLAGRQFSPFVIGLLGVSFCLAAVVVSPIVDAVLAGAADAHPVDRWRIVFLLFAALLLVSNLLFCCLGAGLPQPWTGESVKNGLIVDADNISIEAGILEMKVIRAEPIAD